MKTNKCCKITWEQTILSLDLAVVDVYIAIMVHVTPASTNISVDNNFLKWENNFVLHSTSLNYNPLFQRNFTIAFLFAFWQLRKKGGKKKPS